MAVLARGGRVVPQVAEETLVRTYADQEMRPARPQRMSRPERRPQRPYPPSRGTSTRSKKPRKPKVAPLWARLTLIIGAVVTVAGGLTAGTPAFLQWWFFNKVAVENSIDEDLKGADIDGAINFLLIGIDNPDTPEETSRRADSIMLVHIPASHEEVYMISFPRDTRVTIPPSPETGLDGEWVSKINSAFFVGAKVTGDGPDVWNRDSDLSPAGRSRGAVMTMRAINNLVPEGLGLKFNGWATIDFDGFTAVVEALGGLYMCIDSDVYSIHYYPDGRHSGNPLWRGLNNDDPADGDYGEGYHYTVGCRDLEPWQALDYSRQRYGLPNSDYDRQRHQQQLIRAIVEKVASTDTLTNVNTITTLREAAGDLLTLDLGGHEVLDWAWTLKSLRPDDLVMIKTNGGELCNIPDSSDQCLFPETLDLLRAVKNDTVLQFLSTHRDWVATAT